MTVSLSPARSRAQPRRRQESELRAHLDTHLPDLYARALRLARNDSVAQDVLQDTVERALRFEGQYEQGSNLRAWLQRILLSVFITRCRRARRERRAIEHLTQDPCAWTMPEMTPPSQSLSPSLQRALSALPTAFRQAVELVDVADLSYRDAAEIIGVPLGTVMSRLHRGRRILATAIRDGGAAGAPGGGAPELPEAA
jgi:RNA polymerase sigma-70 factor (ECF subfamily)